MKKPNDCTSFEPKVRDLIQGAERYHERFYDKQPSSGPRVYFHKGPKLYFHKRAFETHKACDPKHLESVYAALVSWDMNRPMDVNKGPRMVDFRDFEDSLMPLKPKIHEAQGFKLSVISGADWTHWDLVESIFKGMTIMEGPKKLVGHSKVMAHMLPDLIPPIDNRFTLKYLHKALPQDLDRQWLLFKEIICCVFAPIAQRPAFKELYKRWRSDQKRFPMDTSVPKVIDNLIVGRVLLKGVGKA